MDQNVPVSKVTKEVLGVAPKNESRFVFSGQSRDQRQNFNKTVRRIRTKAGLPRDFRALHGLRHVYASMRTSYGKVDMHVLQKLLTHKSPR